ncbi:VOC family protein [Nonomuraea rhodomycinica]|uniref:VOC family protein n=1 Tax=Nonomuraea rhodomycinica TaxID=1712872 RepID=UPI0028AC27DA|nr:VOC family protein [Nonomuraea rhodomycinica]
MKGIAEFRTIVLDCANPRMLGEFYAGVLGWSLDDRDDDWVVVTDGGSPKRLAFQRVEDYRPPIWPRSERPQQFHLDLTVRDMEQAEKAVIELGATKHDHQPSEEDTFRVFLDPAGHPFCLCRDVPDD